MRPAVECRDVWKSYHHRPRLGVKELLLKPKPLAASRFTREWALREITFAVEQGATLGIVGNNGSGKSTLLSLLQGTIVVDRGLVQVNGRTASLLEIGAGFHPELTGRENIFLYGSILGVSIAEIRRQFDQIVAFSELDGAIDNPLRTYSNGMITRLGFAVNIHAPATVLLIDEILGVGDSRFQAKCLDYFMAFRRNGGTLVIVSHDLAMLERLCSDGMCLNDGVIVKAGTMKKSVEHYRDHLVAPAPA